VGATAHSLSTPTGLRWSDGCRAALAGWVAARLAVALGFLLAHGLSGHIALPDGRLHLDEGLMTWDGTFYRVIAEGWYHGPATPGEAVRFFPAYPGIGKLLAPITFGNVDVALLLLANIAAVAAGVLVWRLAAEVTGDPPTGIRAAWMVALIPAANVFAFAYTEAPMLLAGAAVLLALHRRSPWVAAAVGLGAGLLRPSGVLLALPAAIEAIRWYLDAPRRRPLDIVGWGAATVAPVAGLAAAMVWVSQPGGDVGESFRIQRQLRDGFRDPLTRLVQAFVDFAHGSLHDIYNVAFALGFAALFVVAVRKRQPLSWLAFMAATWVVAVGGNNMDSVGRYCVVAPPFAIALGQWARARGLQVAVATVGLVATVWFTSEVMLGRIIP